MTKECTPQEIYPTIPQFSVVKDSLARNVLAYLGDYKPFLEKTKQDDQFGEVDDSNDNNNQENGNNSNSNNNSNNNNNNNNNNNKKKSRDELIYENIDNA